MLAFVQEVISPNEGKWLKTQDSEQDTTGCLKKGDPIRIGLLAQVARLASALPRPRIGLRLALP